MKSYVLLPALLLSLGCTGIPLYNSELQSAADSALGAALAEVNSVYAASHLYRVTTGSVTKVIPTGLDTVDLLMVFRIKETQCAKTSQDDPQACAFRPGYFVPSFTCSTRVRMMATSPQVVSLRCGHDGSSSSSSESSEEVFLRRRHQFNAPFANRVPAPAAPSAQPGGSRFNQLAEDRPRGDTFSNYVV
ncbi:secreted phosphoprotein 24 isoform X2 [Oreochromis niloticus]|uniref:secreted phosphoprotein 24 n=1 Tax=Oreochromis aureus TaxID=47969 RepID=UPI00022B2081|nr:secreted phosphoprotein 24 isoform X2 [Oreochromis niloticus]XP_031594344.1 secreted phosphoprotein 24 [Oreochromis aureus]